MKLKEREFIDVIYNIISNNNPIKEYDLMKHLKNKDIEPFASMGLRDNLELFRNHFLLFNLLYKLQNELIEKKTEVLNIHCTKIELIKYSSSAFDIAEYSGLQDYYLDHSNVEGISSEDVSKMIADFWKQYEIYINKNEALKVLDLDQSSSKEEAKARFKKLSKVHHPDSGGDEHEFKKLVDAKKKLGI